MAWENSSVEVRDTSSVKACGNSSVEAWNNSSVEAYGNSNVVAWGSSSVVAFLCSTVVVMSQYSTIRKAFDDSRIIYKCKGKRPCEVGDTVTIVEFENIIKPTFEQWLKRGYVVADGIHQKLVSKKSLGEVVLYTVTDLLGKEESYVAQKADKFSHGKTTEQAIEDLRYKISDRDTSMYESWSLETMATQDEMIECYRKITGACASGVKMFLSDKPDIKEVLSVEDVVNITKGRYNSHMFEDFFKN